MDKNIEVFNNIQNIIYEYENNENILEKIILSISGSFDFNVYLIDKSAKIIVQNEIYKYPVFKCDQNEKHIEFYVNEQINNISQYIFNVKSTEIYIDLFKNKDFENYIYIVYPIYSEFKRIATIIIYREKIKFKEQELNIINMVLCSINLVFKNIYDKEEKQKKQDLQKTKSIIAMLSYSELEAGIIIFKELKGSQGVITISKLASRNNMTTSVIGNCLKKLEASGVIETRSLGVKGKFIKVVNKSIRSEILRFK